MKIRILKENTRKEMEQELAKSIAASRAAEPSRAFIKDWLAKRAAKRAETEPETEPETASVSNVELTSREVEYLQELLEDKNKNREGPWPEPDGDIMSKLSDTKNVELSGGTELTPSHSYEQE